MLVANGGETADQISRAALREGVRIDSRGVWRASYRGLVPKGRVKSLGRARGTATIYPYGTAAQVIAYGRLRKRFGRDYERIGWELWLLGFPVRSRFYRNLLKSTSRTLQAVTGHVEDYSDSGEPIFSDDIGGAIDCVARKRFKSPVLGRLRRALREGDFSTLIVVALGVVCGYSESDQQRHRDHIRIFGRFLGMQAPLKKRRLEDTDADVTPNAFAEMLRSIANIFVEKGSRLFDGFSEAETIEARYELTTLFDIFLSVEMVQRQVFGASSPALQLLRSVKDSLTPFGHAFLLRLWQVARTIPTVRTGAQQLISSVTRPTAFAVQFTA